METGQRTENHSLESLLFKKYANLIVARGYF